MRGGLVLKNKVRTLRETMNLTQAYGRGFFLFILKNSTSVSEEHIWDTISFKYLA